MADIERFELGNNIGAAYALVGRNSGTLAILFLVWVVIVVAVGIAGVIGIRLAIEAIPDLATTAAGMPEETLALINLIPFVIVTPLAMSALIVAWHRRIVTGIVSRNPFSVGLDATLRYVACAIVVFGLSFSPLVLAGAGAATFLFKQGSSTGGGTLAGVVFAILMIACLLLSMRLALLFPATAVGDRSMTLARSWQLTKHSTWRLFWGSFLCALPFSIVGNIIEKLLEVQGLAETAPGVVLAIAGAAVELLGYATVAAFISLAYIQLTGLDGAADRPPASHFS